MEITSDSLRDALHTAIEQAVQEGHVKNRRV